MKPHSFARVIPKKRRCITALPMTEIYVTLTKEESESSESLPQSFQGISFYV
jgi:hypothetical protein